MVFEGPGTPERPGVVHAAGVTQRVICNQKVLREADDLEKYKSVLGR
jgi:hypothetical protein